MFIQALIGKVPDPTVVRGAWDRWLSEVRVGATGFLGSTAGVGDDGTFVAVVRFDSAAACPEPGRWAEMAALLEGDATVLDCDEVIEFLNGGSDDAGFVQVMVGVVTNDDGARTVPEAALEALRRLRPEMIGGTRAFSGSRFVETVYFTSEEAARAAESVELPQIVRDLDRAISVERFISVADPWTQ